MQIARKTKRKKLERPNTKYLICLYKYQSFPINDWSRIHQSTDHAMAQNSTDGKWTYQTTPGYHTHKSAFKESTVSSGNLTE